MLSWRTPRMGAASERPQSQGPQCPLTPKRARRDRNENPRPSPGLTTERLLCQDVGLSRKDEWGVGVLWCLTVTPCDVSEQLLTTETPPCGREKPIRPPASAVKPAWNRGLHCGPADRVRFHGYGALRPRDDATWRHSPRWPFTVSSRRRGSVL